MEYIGATIHEVLHAYFTNDKDILLPVAGDHNKLMDYIEPMAQ
jgi:hypothetical protein